MKAKIVFFHPEALEEAEGAVAWYAKRSDRTAERLVQEIRTALQTISEAPNRWPEFDAGTRSFGLRRFPYRIVYATHADGIRILAVAHGRRRPGYWHGRLGT